MRNVISFLLLAGSAALTAFAGQPLKSVSLKVTVNQTQTLYPYATTDVTADTNGPYVDSQAGVCASFDTNGDLSVNFDCTGTSRQIGWTLNAFLAPPTIGTDSCTSPLPAIKPGGAYTNHLSTGQATGLNAAAFQNMIPYDNTPATIYYVQIFIATAFSDASQTVYRLNYHWAQNFSDTALTSTAEVRRLSATEWVIESVPPSGLTDQGNPPNAGMLVEQTTTKNKSTTIECGFYQVPFSFTLDVK